MGFLANALNYGFTAGSIITKAEKEADRICKGIKTTIIEEDDEKEDGKSDSGEEESNQLIGKIIFHPEWLSDEDRDKMSMPTPTGTTSGSEPPYALEVIENKFTKEDILKNVEAAMKKYDIAEDDDPDDKLAVTTQIAAILFSEGLADAATIFDALDHDPAMYSVTNEFVRYYTGQPMDDKLVPVPDFIENMKDAADEFEELTDWETGYLVDNVSSAVLYNNIKEGHKYIMAALKRLKSDFSIIDVTDESEMVDDQKPVEPFVNIPESIKKVGYSDKEKTNLIQQAESAFEEALKDHVPHYRFNVIGDMMELVVADFDEQKVNSFQIDPNVLLGNGFNILGWKTENNIMVGVYVNAKHADIVKKIIDGKNSYVLTPEEVQVVMDDQFADIGIYYFLDPKNLSDKMDGLDIATRKKIERKLSGIAAIKWGEIPQSRLRIQNWKSEDDFTLVSDEKCRSPLASENQTCPVINPGFKIKVSGDSFKVTYKDRSAEYTINYGN